LSKGEGTHLLSTVEHPDEPAPAQDDVALLEGMCVAYASKDVWTAFPEGMRQGYRRQMAAALTYVRQHDRQHGMVSLEEGKLREKHERNKGLTRPQ
jgi:hypothetical protein